MLRCMEPRFSKDVASISDRLNMLLGNTAPKAGCTASKARAAIDLNDTEAIPEQVS